MGHKVNPNGFRLGVNRGWESRWYANRNYRELVHEDFRLRQLIHKRLANASVSRVEIERVASTQISIAIHTAKPGIVIGKSGESVERLRQALEALTKKAEVAKKVRLSILEIRNPETDATLVAHSISEQLEKRVSFRRAMKQAVQKAMRSGAKGIKVVVGGRLGGAEIARTEKEVEGSVPLQTLRANIDYGLAEAHTTFGVIGVKVWIYHGDILPDRQHANGYRPDAEPTTAEPAARGRPQRAPRRDRGPRAATGAERPRGERGPRAATGADRGTRQGSGLATRPMAPVLDSTRPAELGNRTDRSNSTTTRDRRGESSSQYNHPIQALAPTMPVEVQYAEQSARRPQVQEIQDPEPLMRRAGGAMSRPSETTTPDQQTAVTAFLEASDWADTLGILTREQASLLSDDGLELIRVQIQKRAEAEGRDTVDDLQPKLKLVEEARAKGVDQASRDKVAKLEGEVPMETRLLLYSLDQLEQLGEIDRSIQLAQAALSELTPQANRALWAVLNERLGLLLVENAEADTRGDTKTRLDEAIRCFDRVLTLYPIDEARVKLPDAVYGKGLALRQLAKSADGTRQSELENEADRYLSLFAP